MGRLPRGHHAQSLLQDKQVGPPHLPPVRLPLPRSDYPLLLNQSRGDLVHLACLPHYLGGPSNHTHLRLLAHPQHPFLLLPLLLPRLYESSASLTHTLPHTGNLDISDLLGGTVPLCPQNESHCCLVLVPGRAPLLHASLDCH